MIRLSATAMTLLASLSGRRTVVAAPTAESSGGANRRRRPHDHPQRHQHRPPPRPSLDDREGDDHHRTLIEKGFPEPWRDVLAPFFRPVEESTAPLVPAAAGGAEEGGLLSLDEEPTTKAYVPLLGHTAQDDDGHGYGDDGARRFVPPFPVEFPADAAPEITLPASGGGGYGSHEHGVVSITPLHVRMGKNERALYYNGTVGYPTESGGRSYWGTANSGNGGIFGYEEWIYVPSESMGGREEVGRYAVRGASFASLEVHKDKDQGEEEEEEKEGIFVVRENLDCTGEGCDATTPTKLLRVQTPAAYDRHGNRVDVSLEIVDNGAELLVVLDLPDGSDEGPFLIDPVWTRSDDMQVGRSHHTATLLADGRVLIAGGYDSAGQLTNSAEIYDPLSGSFAVVSPMPIATRSSAQVLLDDGRVLITHGPINNLALLYNVTSDAWAVADPARSIIGAGTGLGQRVVKLPNGQILLTGNFCCPGTEAHIYDPDSDEFLSVASMNKHRQQHTLTVLGDGSVLAAGGGTNCCGYALISNTAELFVPDNSTGVPSYVDGTWIPLVNRMNAGHFDHEATLIEVGDDAGKVLICAGLDGATYPGGYLYTGVCELYDPVTRDFERVANIPSVRQRSGTGNGGDFLATVKAGASYGSVVVAGGYPSVSRTAVYDPHTRTWSPQCDLYAERLRHQTVGLQDGSVAVFGGQTGPSSQALLDVERLFFGDDDDDS